jgi:VWFA-related protein
MPTQFRRGLYLLASFLCAAVLSAQQNEQPGHAPASTIDLNVVVTAKSGPPVAGLQQQDFTVFDNKAQRPITSFKAMTGSQDPIHVILVIDAVNVFYQTIAYEREQMDNFLHANGGRLAQPTTLVFFTDNGVELQNSYSTDGNELSSTLDQHTISLRNILRSSQYQGQDRFNLSLKALGEIVESQKNLPGRKMILWVSPGWPLLSGPRIYLDAKQANQIFGSIVGLSTELRRAGVTLYAISPLGTNEGVGREFYYQEYIKGVSKPNNAQLGNLSLQVLAVQSGGLALSGSNDVAKLVEQCMADAQAYYQLSFTPPPADHQDEYHNVEVRLDKPGLTARTRLGYYNQP